MITILYYIITYNIIMLHITIIIIIVSISISSTLPYADVCVDL